MNELSRPLLLALLLVGLTAPACGDDDDTTTAGDTSGETTGTGDSQGADCDKVAGTQPCNCLTTVVAVGKQTCTDEGWSACECPGACEETKALHAWCPNPVYDKSPNGLQINDAPAGGDPACAEAMPINICLCEADSLSVEVLERCLPATDTGDTGE